MKITQTGFLLIYLLLFMLGSGMCVTAALAAESSALDESAIQSYLEKKVAADPGSCLVEDMKMEIIGIADLVPEHQAEVFYKFEYTLRCNRSKDSKSGQGVLKAVRLRDGNWLDREAVAIISK